MDWIEVTARTVEDAKELALDRLGVVEDELEYEVLDEARTGLFGLGRVDARIRARVKPLSREKPSDRRRKRRPAERAGRGTRPAASAETSGSREGAPKTEPATEPPTARTPGKRRSRRGRGGRAGAARAATAEPEAPRAENTRVEVDEVDSVPVTAQAEAAATFSEELVRIMGFPAAVRTEIDDQDITVHIDGDGLGTLVGPRGVTLQALEEVVRAVVQHHAGGHSAWVHVDVGGYRERRREALMGFARQVAAEVKETGTARVLEPMNAGDRKLVHDTVAEIEGVATGSEGEEPRRRVVIKPA